MAASWVYLDETAHTEIVQGRERFRDMIVGGCRASEAQWRAFSIAWRKALDEEGVATFHGKNFFSYNDEFRWYRNGAKDEERHARFRDKLVQIILDHVEEIVGYCNAAEDVARPVREAYKKSIANAFRTLTGEWGQQVYVVLARHPELSPWTVLKIFEQQVD